MATEVASTSKYSVSARTHFIMVHPSHPGNVGAAARAIKTMGFDQLCLVKPRFEDMINQPEAIAFASGAQDILQQTTQYETLAQALAPVTLSFALTARPRDMGPAVLDIRQAGQMAAQHLHNNPVHQIALVLGTERTGLSNEQISHCHHICYIPANPAYSSLNVAQALQLSAWELRYSLQSIGQMVTNFTPPATETPATSASVEALLTHWQKALEAIEFLDPQHPKKLMLRMRYWFTRSHLSCNEVDMMRGVCTQILKNAIPSKTDKE